MKKKISALIALSSLFTVNLATAGQVLAVTNIWNKSIFIRENVLFPENYAVRPHGNIFYPVPSGSIDNLTFSYMDDSGRLRPILNCPTGHFNTSIEVYVHASAADANVPVCDNV